MAGSKSFERLKQTWRSNLSADINRLLSCSKKTAYRYDTFKQTLIEQTCTKLARYRHKPILMIRSARCTGMIIILCKTGKYAHVSERRSNSQRAIQLAYKYVIIVIYGFGENQTVDSHTAISCDSVILPRKFLVGRRRKPVSRIISREVRRHFLNSLWLGGVLIVVRPTTKKG